MVERQTSYVMQIEEEREKPRVRAIGGDVRSQGLDIIGLEDAPGEQGLSPEIYPDEAEIGE